MRFSKKLAQPVPYSDAWMLENHERRLRRLEDNLMELQTMLVEAEILRAQDILRRTK